MQKKDSDFRKGYRSRASLARPKYDELSYSERLERAMKGKKKRGIDIGAEADSAGYIKNY
ncbi:hypothetical protein O1O06_15595 [Grimontia hollisae]|uniref:hypothetical protein n=1 Tax=Grimontia hollisae TaxID=673 RepID=UPI001303CE78|nr:hypothetical protein [Grimontia hollisae]MDF2186167.1 hypothetical protein [Grimontia hollisae]